MHADIFFCRSSADVYFPAETELHDWSSKNGPYLRGKESRNERLETGADLSTRQQTDFQKLAAICLAAVGRKNVLAASRRRATLFFFFLNNINSRKNTSIQPNSRKNEIDRHFLVNL